MRFARGGARMAADADARPRAAWPGLWGSWAAIFRRLQSGMVLRLGWGVADQAMSSLTNFAVSIYVVHVLGAVQFGAFSLAYVTYSFALTASRGLATDPLMVRFSGTDLATWRRSVAGCTGTAAAVGLASGACVLAAAAFLGGPVRAAFLALGLTLPGLLLQDSWRYSFFALGRGRQAFLNDTIWAVLLLPALVLLRVTGNANVFWFVLAWGAAANIAAAVGPLQARVLPRLSGAWEWLSRHRDLGPRYFAEGCLVQRRYPAAHLRHRVHPGLGRGRRRPGRHHGHGPDHDPVPWHVDGGHPGGGTSPAPLRRGACHCSACSSAPAWRQPGSRGAS